MTRDEAVNIISELVYDAVYIGFIRDGNIEVNQEILTYREFAEKILDAIGEFIGD